MRFPIRFQMLLPTSMVMLAVVLGSSAVNVWLAQRSARSRIQARINEVAEMLEHASFPLTGRVLEQMAGLAGAEFVLVSSRGEFLGTSDAAFEHATLPPNQAIDQGFGEMQTYAGNQYFHRVLTLHRPEYPSSLQLHVFFHADEYRRIWQRALLPSLVAVGAALTAALACASWVGGSVSTSTKTILHQLDSIAAGNFQPAPIPRRNDELKDISTAINRTAVLLDGYEANVREGERMKTLVAMGAGLAHQIRNSATGCRMAIDLVAEDPQSLDQEALHVARRQLSLMENYLQRFLLMAKVEPHRIRHETTNLNEILDQAVALVVYSARHLHVDVQWTPTDSPLSVTGDEIALEQAIVNLLLNAIEAASTEAVSRAEDAGISGAQVRVDLNQVTDNTVAIVVSDNGPGPRGEQDVFAPFVSEKKRGIGLGLAVVREVAEAHGGRATWRRRDDWTEFVIELPLRSEPE